METPELPYPSYLPGTPVFILRQTDESDDPRFLGIRRVVIESYCPFTERYSLEGFMGHHAWSEVAFYPTYHVAHTELTRRVEKFVENQKK